MWKSYPQAFKHTNPAKYDKIKIVFYKAKAGTGSGSEENIKADHYAVGTHKIGKIGIKIRGMNFVGLTPKPIIYFGVRVCLEN